MNVIVIISDTLRRAWDIIADQPAEGGTGPAELLDAPLRDGGEVGGGDGEHV